MNRVLVVCLLLQAVYAERNNSISIGSHEKSPADVTYVKGNAPDELKAGPTKNSTTESRDGILHAAFIHSSGREIPKDDEIENEEFERFIKKYHNRPTIETVFVSSSPSPLVDEEEDAEEINEEYKESPRSQAEFFKRPAEYRTFERSIAHPTVLPSIFPPSDHGHTHTIVNHHPHGLNFGGGISYGGGDGGILVQGDGGQYGTFINGQYFPGTGGGEQQYYQVTEQGFVPRTFNVAQQAFKTKTFQIRRPAIQKHYYDIEERVIIRPAGSIVVELDRPVAKIPTGETIVPVGGLQGGFAGVGFQQSQGGTQGGFSGLGIQQSQGGFDGSGFQQSQDGLSYSTTSTSSVPSFLFGGPQGRLFYSTTGEPHLPPASPTPPFAIGGPQGGFAGIGIQQAQGGVGGPQGSVGIQQGQGVIGVSQAGPQGGLTRVGIQQAQGAVGGPQGGVGIQQAQGAIGVSQAGPQGGPAGVGIQQAQGGAQGGIFGGGFQQSQGGISSSTTPATSTSSVSIGGSQGGLFYSSTGVPYLPPATPTPGLQGGFTGTGFQQSQGAVGVSQGGSQGGLAGVGIQQSQGAIGGGQAGSQGGLAGVGIQQSQGAIGVGQAGSQGGIGGVGIQQSQGGIGVSQEGSQQPQGAIGVPQGGAQGGLAGTGISFLTTSGTPTVSVTIGGSQGGVSYSTTGAFIPPASPTPTVIIGGTQGGIGGAGFQQSQGAIGVGQAGSQGGIGGGGFQQSQGVFGVGQTGSQGGLAGVGIQQSQGAVGVGQAGSQGGIGGAGSQQSQGAAGVGQAGSQGGLAGVGIQQSQGAAGVGQAGPQGGIGGAGFQQSQGAIGVGQAGSQGGLAGVGIQQSQVGQAGSQGGIGGAGFQQSQGAIGVGQAGSQGGLAGVGIQQSQGADGTGFQQSQGGVFYSTSSGPYLPPVTPTPSYFIRGPPGKFGSGFQQYVLLGYPTPTPVSPDYPGTSTITATPTQQANNDDSVVVEARSNVQNRGTFASTTTTERSFSSTVNQDASAYARGSASGSVQAVSKNITPYMITVGEPDFHYPPYVEINSHGSPLGHLVQQPYAQVKATSSPYPRMRYQGRLLTGEVQTDELARQQQQSAYGALSRDIIQQHTYESPAYVVEIPPNTPNEEQHEQPGDTQANTQHHRQYVGSSQQLPQVSQIAGNGHQQPAQVHQHHFVTSTPQPIEIAEVRSISHQGDRQHFPDVTQQPVHVANYRSKTQQPAPVYEDTQHAAQVNHQPTHSPQYHSRAHQRPNLVAQIRHQQASQQPAQVYQQHDAEASQQPTHGKQIQNSFPQQHVVEVTSQPIEVADVQSSTQYQQQVAQTTQQPEPFNSGQRLYQQRPAPLKYTQHHTINVAPSQHTILFSNQPRQLEQSSRSQKLEIPPEPEGNVEDASIQSSSTSIVSSTPEALISSTTIAPTPRQVEHASHHQQQTYASILANSKPGILYASSGHAIPHHSQRNPQSNTEGSSLFSPSGRQLHLAYSQPSRAAYSQPTASVNSGGHQISLTNEGVEAPIPITHQRQIQQSQQSTSQPHEAISSSTSPSTISSTERPQTKRRQKYRNEQTRGALTLRSGRIYGDHRVIASTPAPSDGSAASESVQTRRIVVNHPFQTVQEVVEREPITKIQQVTVNEPEVQSSQDDLQQVQQKASYRRPAAYKVPATYDHPAAPLSYHHGGSH